MNGAGRSHESVQPEPRVWGRREGAIETDKCWTTKGLVRMWPSIEGSGKPLSCFRLSSKWHDQLSGGLGEPGLKSRLQEQKLYLRGNATRM